MFPVVSQSNASNSFWSYLALFLAQTQKIKKILREKNSLNFRKWNFLALILKKIIIFYQNKAVLILCKTETPQQKL